MHKQSAASSRNASAGATTEKARGKKKVLGFPSRHNEAESSLKPQRRQSVPEWDEMGSNIRRVDTRACIKRNSTIAMPETHHGFANSSMPIPLNTIMMGWKNVPKLHQYQPAELQVVYHRRTGEVVTVTPETRKSFQDDLELRSEETTKNQNGSVGVSTSKLIDDIIPVLGILGDSEPRDKEQGSKTFHDEFISSTNELSPLSEHHRTILTTTECQTESHSTSSKCCQTDVKEMTVETQTEATVAELKNECINTTCNDSQTITVLTKESSTSTSPELLNENSKPYQCSSSSSQTEALNLNLSSQSTCASVQTNSPEMISRAAETVKSTFSIAEVQVAISIQSFSVYSQTEIDIQEPIICMECECKQFQVDELEEKLDELTQLLRTKEKEVKLAQEISLAITSSCNKVFENASTETSDEIYVQISVEELQKQQILEQENKQLKVTNESLKTQLGSFQHGLTRLRSAIEKPIPEDLALSEEAINEALNKADGLIISYSNSKNRAIQINDHLSVLNSCVSVANGILEDKPK